MYQILGLRDYVNGKGKLTKRHAFFEKNWRFTTIEQLFENNEEVMSAIPEADRWNIYFTAADCFDIGEARKLKEQWIIPFDIDNLGFEVDEPHEVTEKKARAVFECACEVLKVEPAKTAAIVTGNGLQFFVKLPRPILSDDYFDTLKEQYKVVMERIKTAMTIKHLVGKPDQTAFIPAKLLRLPNTENRKPHGVRKAFVLQGHIEAQEFNLETATGDAEIRKSDTINKEAWKQRNYKPDEEGVLAGCEYLKWAKEKPNDVDESQWYALLGTLAFLPNGQELAHKYSEGYKGYDANETQEKFEQALRASGPRTCKDLGNRWNGCANCHHYNQVTAPIMIQGPNHIPTKDTGFRRVNFDDNGKPKAGKVEYDDLVKHFMASYEYIKVNENGMYVYSKEEKKWNQYSKNLMSAWMYGIVKSSASAAEMKEFISRMEAINVKENDWLDRSDDRHINFNNGVLDRATYELKPHSSEYGFKYVLPYDYSASATAPKFEQFLKDICCDDMELVQLLKEFGGYCISGDNYWEHKALFLVGEGANGKSTYVDVLKGLVGQRGYSSMMMQDLQRQENRSQLVNKLFNFSEETSVKALLDSSLFKALSSGGEISVRLLFENPFQYRNIAKLMVACNELPTANDTTHGMFRRIIIAPFNKVFSKAEVKYRYSEELLQEASGIYNSMLHSYQAAKKSAAFVEPTQSIKALNDYRYESDPVSQFIEECVNFIPDQKETPTSEVYKLYADYCVSNGYKDRIRSNVSFGKLAAKLTSGKLRGEMVSRDGKKYRVVKGVSLNQVF